MSEKLSYAPVILFNFNKTSSLTKITIVMRQGRKMCIKIIREISCIVNKTFRLISPSVSLQRRLSLSPRLPQ